MKTLTLGGKVHVNKRMNSGFRQRSTYIACRCRVSTKQERLKLPNEFPDDWHLTMRDKKHSGELVSEAPFKQTAGLHLHLHLIPFLGDMGLLQVIGGKVQEYRIHRMTPSNRPTRTLKAIGITPPGTRSTARSSLFGKCLRRRHGWPVAQPDLSLPTTLPPKSRTGRGLAVSTSSSSCDPPVCRRVKAVAKQMVQ